MSLRPGRSEATPGKFAPGAASRDHLSVGRAGSGAAKIAYGDASVATPQAENETHRGVFTEFRKQMSERQPKLAVETGLMALDGSVEMFG